MPGHPARKYNPIGDVPELRADCAFYRNKKSEKKSTATVLVMADRKLTGVCANVVLKKSVGGGFIVKQMDRDIRKFGHRHKILTRSGGEPAIRDLLEKVADMRTTETIVEHTPAGDSRANVRAERAVQVVEKQTRVLKLSTEQNLGGFSVLHKAFPWLVLHAADVDQEQGSA